MSRGHFIAAAALAAVCALLVLTDPALDKAIGHREVSPGAAHRPEARAAEAFTHRERRAVAVALAPETLATMGAALEAQMGRTAGTAGAISEARAGRIDAVELGRRLHETTAGHAEQGGMLLGALVEERSPAVALQLAHSLAGLENDSTLRAQTVAALREGPAAAREVGLLSLLGRGEPEALQLAADTLQSGTPFARATAAFVLNNAPLPLNGDVADRTLATAREALTDSTADTRLREESTTLLGQPGAPEQDVALLERTILGGEPAVRMRALAALEATGVSMARMQAACDRVLRDSSAPERLLEMARAWRAAHP